MIVVEDADLHVIWSPDMWRVRGREGDHGLVKTRQQAIAIACDASAQNGGTRAIVVHDRYYRKLFRITQVKIQPSSQLFQDDGDDDSM